MIIALCAAEIRCTDRVDQPGRDQLAPYAAATGAGGEGVERGGDLLGLPRGGRRIATIAPADAANGSATLALLTGAVLDDDFAADVLSAREAAVAEGPAWPAG